MPTFFRLHCHTAAHGGAKGYFDAGWHLALATPSLLEPLDYPEVVQGKLDELRSALDSGDFREIIAWYEKEFPKCMELVPQRRRNQFARAIVEVDETRGITDL